MNLKKGTILEWAVTRELYSAKKGDQAIVRKDYNSGDNYVSVEWIDEANGQLDGDYKIRFFIVVKKVSNDPIEVLMKRIGYEIEGEIDYA